LKVVVQCPAKVNYFLSVGPKEESGYHPIRTVLQAISLYDTLTLTTDVNETTVQSSWADLPASNTLTKALRLVSEMVNMPPVAIYLEKRIPAESGLGGGSSDAAGLLRALQLILQAPLPGHMLMDVAAAVGMDVPFFLMGGTAAAEGYGERLTPLPDRDIEWLVVVKPEVGCPTADAYSALDEKTFDWRPMPTGEFFELYNDFECVAPCECLDLIELLKTYGAADAALSGSGSAAFGRFPSGVAAEAAKEVLARSGYPQSWVVHTLSRAESLAISWG
jgi:4-diphosphocytidyl-2-C-methyl-D-erythritol kinase